MDKDRDSLTIKDYVIWIATIVVIYIFTLYIGNWGVFRNIPQSPQTAVISDIYRIVYVLAMAVFSIFAGTIAFFVVKFRGGDEDEL